MCYGRGVVRRWTLLAAGGALAFFWAEWLGYFVLIFIRVLLFGG